MAARKSRPPQVWGRLSRASRDRWAANAQAQFGLSRRSVREMYNRGTYNPGAKNPEQRIPQKVQREQNTVALRAAVVANFNAQLAGSLRWTPGAQQRLANRLPKFTAAQLWRMAAEPDIRSKAHFQANQQGDDDVPDYLFYEGDDGEVMNIFFYG